MAGWIWVPVEHCAQSTCSTRTTSSALSYWSTGSVVTWSLTQCGQRQLPPSMLCSLLCPPGIVSIENAIYLYISVYLILPTALMESIAGCLPILATAHGLSLPHAMCKAVNPWSSCTICSSSCVFVHKCAFWQNFAHFIQRRGVGFDL